MECPICLEKLPELSEQIEDQITVPELECNCAFFTHLHCWDSWACINGGICLYCRFTNVPPPPTVQVSNAPDHILKKMMITLLLLFTIYLYIHAIFLSII